VLAAVVHKEFETTDFSGWLKTDKYCLKLNNLPSYIKYFIFQITVL